MATTTRGPARDPYDEPPDATAYVRLRWLDLVDSLVALDVPAGRAREAVARAVVAHERGWRRILAQDDPDALVWAEACRVAGVPAPPLYPPLLGHLREGGVGDPLDRPEAWLARARTQRLAAVRRQWLWALTSLAAVVVVVAAATTWWSTRLVQPPVRPEVNEVPVPWYADGELHLDRVVVVMPDVADFVAVEDAVVARLDGGRVVEVAADGVVRAIDDAPATLDAPDEPDPPGDLPLGPYDRVAQAVYGPGRMTVFLIDSGALPAAGSWARASETGRRAVLVCSGGGVFDVCSSPRVLGAGGDVSLH